MNIVVIKIRKADHFPPVLSLVNALLDLGHSVTLITNEATSLPSSLLRRERLATIELGECSSKKQAIEQLVIAPNIIHRYYKDHKNEIDCVWTVTDTSARMAGIQTLEFPYVMQLNELVEYVPLFRMDASRLHSRQTVEMARHASCVVVPEYNRAYIQQAWWDLPQKPIVLPNKPYPDDKDIIAALPSDVEAQIKSDDRKKLLYQGIFSSDRSLNSYAQAVAALGDDYALYVMGKPIDDAGKLWDTHLSEITNNYVNIGFIPAPNHLSVTPYGFIGLLPYKPSKFAHYSILNALYCAPNKIWEYSRYGLPMIGSDVPGLTYTFNSNGIGITTNDNPSEIIDAVRAIECDYDNYKTRSSNYYYSIDVKAIIGTIIDEATK